MLKINKLKPMFFDVRPLYLQLKEIDAIITSKGYNYCVFGGVLLGYIRHQELMSWDYDIDILMEEKDMFDLEQTIEESGYEITKYSKPINRRAETIFPKFIQLKKDKILIEIWPSRKKGDIVETCVGDFKTEDVYPFNRTSMKGVEFKIPNNPEHFLDRNYSNWRNIIIKGIRNYDNMFVRENFSS